MKYSPPSNNADLIGRLRAALHERVSTVAAFDANAEAITNSLLLIRGVRHPEEYEQFADVMGFALDIADESDESDESDQRNESRRDAPTKRAAPPPTLPTLDDLVLPVQVLPEPQTYLMVVFGLRVAGGDLQLANGDPFTGLGTRAAQAFADSSLADPDRWERLAGVFCAHAEDVAVVERDLGMSRNQSLLVALCLLYVAVCDWADRDRGSFLGAVSELRWRLANPADEFEWLAGVAQWTDGSPPEGS